MAERVAGIIEVCEGLTEIAITANPGGFAHWQAIKTQEIFADAVAPRFRRERASAPRRRHTANNKRRGTSMRQRRLAAVAVAVAAIVALVAVATSSAARTAAAGKPIVIGAAIDLTKNMAPFDAPALEAAQIEIKKINAAGGVDGRPLEIKFLNDQLDPARTKSDAIQLVDEGVNIGWVTCDVDYATPAIQTFLAAKLLTVSPCIGTDQMGPSTLRRAGNLAFTFGNPAQQDGAAAAEWAYSHGWHTADVVTDKLLVYFQNVCQAFTLRFQQLGGKIVDQESFTQGDKTIGNVATRINGKKASVIAFCTSFGTDAAGVRRRPAHARQQDADHQRLGERRRLLVVEEPEDHQLLLPHLRVRADPGSVRGGERVRGEDGGDQGAGADRRVHHRSRRDRRDRLRHRAGPRVDQRGDAGRTALAPDQVPDARRPDQLHAGVAQRRSGGPTG